MDDYKVAVIFGDEEKDGQIIKEGDAKSDDLHIQTLIDISKKYFSYNPIFSHFTVRHQANLPAYFMTDMGNVVFLNLTKYSEDSLRKYGRNGMFMMPKEISEKQAEAIRNIVSELNDFDIIINYDLYFDAGFVEGKTAMCFKGVSQEELAQKVLSTAVLKRERTK